MNIQDIVITIAQTVISFSLIPQVVLGFQTKTGPVSYWTSIPYALSLGAIALALASLNLWLSTGVTVISVLLWATLALQRYLYHT